MSEVVSYLVVSLSLNAGEFQRKMRAINASTKEAESTFRLAGAGMDKFGSSLGGQQAKLPQAQKKSNTTPTICAIIAPLRFERRTSASEEVDVF